MSLTPMLRRLRRLSLSGIARAAAFLFTAWALVLAGSAASVRAQVSELLLGLGADVERFAGAEAREEPTDVELNGLVLRMTSVISERTVTEVLDAAELDCTRRDGRLGEQASELYAEHDVSLDPREYDGTVRDGDDTRGYVACLDMGPERVPADEVIARIQRFLETHDVSDVGQLRYVYARRDGETTHVLSWESVGSLDLDALMPSEGDAPGADLPRFPRAPGLRRAFTARAGDEPYGLVSYAADSASRDDLVRWYRAALPEQGYRLLELEDGQMIEVDGAVGFVVEEGDASIAGRTVVLTFDETPEGLGLLTVLAADTGAAVGEGR
jgi:hypothetical protein